MQTSRERTAVAMVLVGFAVALLVAPAVSTAQTRIMPLGDSITDGGGQYASYRYELFFDLLAAGKHFDFVGEQDETFVGGVPNPAWYPNYDTTFDRDHEGHWGRRTFHLEGLIAGAAAATNPDIVLLHAGTNDVGHFAAAGVAQADMHLRNIIGLLRNVNPNVTVILAQIIPMDCCHSFFQNAAFIDDLNLEIADIVADLDTPTSRVFLVDMNTDYDLGTMMQPDGLHPNLVGEAWLADQWQTVLTPLVADAPPVPSRLNPVVVAAVGLVIATLAPFVARRRESRS